MRHHKHSGIFFLFLLQLLIFCNASTPNVIVSVGIDSYLAKRGLFGSSDEEISGVLVSSVDTDDPLMCNYSPGEETTSTLRGSIMLIPRGECTFQKKVYAAQERFGVSGVLIYDNLSSKYRWNETEEEIIFPRDQWDYECENGYGTLELPEMPFDPPQYNASVMDDILIGCNLEKTRSTCDSKICLITSHKANSTIYPVCCAWDLPTTMDGDDEAGEVEEVVAVFITMSQAEITLPQLGQIVTITARPRSAFNISSIFLWILAVGITIFGSWFAAKEYREFGKVLDEFKEKQGTNNDVEKVGNAEDEFIISSNDLEGDESDDEMKERSFRDESDSGKGKIFGRKKKAGGDRKGKGPSTTLYSIPPARKTEKKKPDLKSGEQEDGSFVLYSLPPPERKKKGKKKKPPKPVDPDDNAIDTATREVTGTDEIDDGKSFIPSIGSSSDPSFEIGSWHVFGFVASASIMLFLLFYFRFFGFIFVLYALGCAGAVSYLIFSPILVKTIPKLGDAVVEELNKEVCVSLYGILPLTLGNELVF